MKNELEELGFEALYPMRSRVLREWYAAPVAIPREIIDSIQSEIEGRLREAGIDAQVSGREKNLFSIYNKMEKKELQFHEVMDIYAFRVRVKDIDTCYRVLGQMHSLYKPRPVASRTTSPSPRPTATSPAHLPGGPHGYRWRCRSAPSSWTRWPTRASPPTGPTSRMGTARAPRPRSAPALDAEPAGAATERRQLLRVHRGGQDRPLPDEIYVFTPEGRIMELPAGAAPVDFAYTVHTDIGHACVGSRVDRHPYPLSSPLHSGRRWRSSRPPRPPTRPGSTSW
jgi:guanosine-3',5'-bis(diphosphate) 3'-pyrophosphohydrolase